MKETLNGLKESGRILAEIVCFLRLGGATFGVGNVDNVLSDSLDRRRRGRRGDQIAGGMVPRMHVASTMTVRSKERVSITGFTVHYVRRRTRSISPVKSKVEARPPAPAPASLA